MTDTTKNKGGRPPLPPPPTTATETRALIAAELVKTKPSTFRVRQLQKLLRSQELAADFAIKERANTLLTEANELKRSEYLRRYELGQQRADAEVAADSRLVERLDNMTTENSTLHSTVTTLQGELAQVKDELVRTKSERDEFQQANETLTKTVARLQPQADTLARIRNEAQGELSAIRNTDQRLLNLQAEFDSLEDGERTLTDLERMQELLLQIKILRQAYSVKV
jgi:uncharacterized coiled-coil DUF342 family protein